MKALAAIGGLPDVETSCDPDKDEVRGAATGVAAFQKLKGLRCLDEDLNLQPSIQAGHSIFHLG